MRTGMECLLQVLRGQAGERPVDPTEWEDTIELAARQHVLPLLAHKLLQSDVPLPAETQARLEQAEREALLYSFLQVSELKELLSRFSAAAIDVLPLKGPPLAERVYGRASLRISCDLDLLVRKAHFPAAALLLEGLGFVPEAIPDDYHQKWRRGKTIVELHFDVENPRAIDFDIESAWENASPGEFRGQPAWQLAAEDELLYLCLHVVRHRFDRMSLVVDVALALDRLKLRPGSPLTLRKEVQVARRFVTLGCAMARRLYPEAPPAPDIFCSDAERRSMERLADRLWSDLLTKPASQQDWSSMHAFYLQTELTPFRRIYRRLQHLRILSTRLIDADFAFAARVGLTRTWQVRLLRFVRLALRGNGEATHPASKANCICADRP